MSSTTRRMSTLVLTLFTFWPPAPPLRAKLIRTSSAHSSKGYNLPARKGRHQSNKSTAANSSTFGDAWHTNILCALLCCRHNTDGPLGCCCMWPGLTEGFLAV